MRTAGFVLAVIGVFGIRASLSVDAAGRRPLALLPIFILLLAAALVLFVRAHRLARRKVDPGSR
jgi:hypothetical protein